MTAIFIRFVAANEKGTLSESECLVHCQKTGFYFALRTASLQAFATRNFTTFLAGILIVSPVAGLRPMRALRFTKTSLPKPGKVKLFLAFLDRKSTRLNSSHGYISYAVFC